MGLATPVPRTPATAAPTGRVPASPSLGLRRWWGHVWGGQASLSSGTGHSTTAQTRTPAGSPPTPGQETDCSPEGLILLSTSPPLSDTLSWANLPQQGLSRALRSSPPLPETDLYCTPVPQVPHGALSWGDLYAPQNIDLIPGLPAPKFQDASVCSILSFYIYHPIW